MGGRVKPSLVCEDLNNNLGPYSLPSLHLDPSIFNGIIVTKYCVQA